MCINAILIATKDFVPAHMSLPTGDTYNKLIEQIWKRAEHFLIIFWFAYKAYSSLDFEYTRI